MFEILPYSTPQKIGIVFYGLLVGFAVAVLTSLTLCVIAFVPLLSWRVLAGFVWESINRGYLWPA